MISAAPKYRPAPVLRLPDRTWPDAVIEAPPVWCSVDLRDGNQALVDPMDSARKFRLWNTLVSMGFKEIEVGFPAASETDYAFVRALIEGGHIPDDVTIQILTQAREPIIRRSFEAIEGAPNVIMHLYNSTSEAQRRLVFGFDRQGCVDLAVSGTALVRDLSARRKGGEVRFQYSPESFTGTEPDFAVEIVERVAACWGTGPDRKMICNLPATVENATPNVYADVIEWFGRTVRNRDSLILSVHPHNDRGSGIAAAELAVMAGADRVEGTLFGNGERTGNVDLCTLALNMFTQGVDPGLDLSDIAAIREAAEECTGMEVPPRHPYAGDLVFTAFSGSHQDAIHKGLAARRASNDEHWEVPYLPIDPTDIGRTFEAVVRINSQSGKGGVAHVLERDHGVKLPRFMQADFARLVQRHTDATGAELDSAGLMDLFTAAYLAPGRLSIVDYVATNDGKGGRALWATVDVDGAAHAVRGAGSGPVDAFLQALTVLDIQGGVRAYHEQAMGGGSDAEAMCFIEIADAAGKSRFGVGRHGDVTMAALMAVCGAVG